MSKNIKEIGKELLGKSLNSFHRKTGLTQLEKNNEMQDGILDGILSQVGDAYIEKTEQSNVIHLDGSGDGVVVLDSIEGNTMVNILKYKNIQWVDGRWNDFVRKDQLIQDLKTNTEYTIVVDVSNWSYNQGVTLCCDDTNVATYFKGNNIPITGNGRYIAKRTTKADFSTLNIYNILYSVHNPDIINGTCNVDMMIFEGDWTNKEIPPYFEGIKSSFEEKVNDDGKYEIEILSKNKSLIDWNIENLINHKDNKFVFLLEDNAIKVRSNYGTPYQFKKGFYVKEGEKYTIQIEGRKTSGEYSAMYMGGEDLCYPKGETYILVPAATSGNIIDGTTYGKKTVTMIARKSGYVDRFYIHSHGTGNFYWIKNIYLEKGETVSCIPYKQNKIKLLINEPLRSVPNGFKDRLYVKNNKLVVERNCKYVIINGSEGNYTPSGNYNTVYRYWCSTSKFSDIKDSREDDKCICDNNVYNHTNYDTDRENINIMKTGVNLKVLKSKVNSYGSINDYLIENPIKCIYQLEEPYYEEVLNEYGEPIILEGYEDGTIYIDSTIIPTTTVRYTPKMESLNTLKKISNNNTLLSNDVNDTIIPYMMEVDLMIMEKEMVLPSQINNRKVEVLDMTSMQKRTQEMLERLIKGKTLTEQECKTRVTTYLNAGKITDEQAEELMLLIDEVYA